MAPPDSDAAGPEKPASDLLHLGQSHESHGELFAALACYNRAIAHLIALAETESPDDAIGRERMPIDEFGPLSSSHGRVGRLLAIAWMNRGNALQKFHVLRGTYSEAAVAAYDQTISLLEPLAVAAPADHALRNSLGAAYLNRAGALLGGHEAGPSDRPEDLDFLRRDADSSARAALDSADRAIATLVTLPLDENISHRANLAGAHLNRASALLCNGERRHLAAARASACLALDLTVATAENHLAFAHVSLGARHALLAIVGRELSAPDRDAAGLLAEAGDVVDAGLALARRWERRCGTAFRPAAAQLFYTGAILYASYQPHFLAEFLDENHVLARERPALVEAILTRARRTAHERCLVANSAEPLSRTFHTLTDLSAIADRLAGPGPTGVPALP